MTRLLALLAVAVYLAMPVPVYNYNELRVALVVREGGSLPFNIYHPLSTWLQALVMRMWAGAPLGAWTAVNGFLSVACLVLVRREWRDAGGSTGVATGLAACLGVTLPFWFYATTPETYPLAMLGVLCFFRSARHAVAVGSVRAAAMTGVIAAAAIGLNASSIALAVAFLVAPATGRQRVVFVGAFGLAIALGVASLRVAAAPDLSPSTIATGIHNVTGRGEHPLVVVARAPYLLAGAREPCGDVFHIDRLQTWRAAVAQGVSLSMAATAVALVAVLAGLAAFALRRGRDGMLRVHCAALIAWLALFSLGDPRNGFLYVILVPLGALAAPLLAEAPRRVALAALGTCCAALILLNLTLSVLPNRDPDANPMLKRALSLRDLVGEQDVVVARSTLTCLYDACFLPAHICWVDATQPSVAAARGAIKAALLGGGAAYVEPEVFEFAEGWQGLSERVLDMLEGYAGTLRPSADATDALVLLTPAITPPSAPASKPPPSSASMPAAAPGGLRITRITPPSGTWLPTPQHLPVTLALAPPPRDRSTAGDFASPQPIAARIAVLRTDAAGLLALTEPLAFAGSEERIVGSPAFALESPGGEGAELVVRAWAVARDGHATASSESRNPLGGRVTWRQPSLPALSDSIDVLGVEPRGTLAAGRVVSPRVRFYYSVRSVPCAYVSLELRQPDASRGAWHVSVVALPRGIGIADVQLAPARVPASLAGETFPLVLAFRVDPLGGSLVAPIVAEYRVTH